MKRFLSCLMMVVLLLACVCPYLAPAAEAAGSLYWPVPGHTGTSRGYTGDHPALDITDGSVNGAAVIAAMGGTVNRIYLCGTQHYGDLHDCSGFGTGIVIKGDDGRFYQYAHMMAGSMPSYVYYGGRIEAGAMIGRVGTTGNSSGPHLHFGISNGTSWHPCNVDPATESYVYADPGQYPGMEVTMAWTNGTETRWDTNFYTYIEAVANISGVYGEAGITVWDPFKNIVAQKFETPGSSSKAKLQIWYNITDEIGVVLTPGVTYTYQYHVKFNGTYYYSPAYTISTTGSHAHSYGAWTTETAATCTASGKQVRSCTICAAGDSQTISATGHSYKSSVTAPTCGKQGYTTYTCSVCGDSYKDNYKNATGKHTYSNNNDTTCNVCGYTRTIEVETTPMYRLYNPNSGEHFYTGSAQERDNLVKAGWNYEGIGWNAPIKGGDPVYRIFNPNSGDHHYTMSWSEVKMLEGYGWKYEGVAWNSAGPEPQYRLYNPNADCGSHHYTSSLEERDYLVSLGWMLEGIGWYGIPN